MSKIHWPEITKFCGLFSLNAGIYVYAVTNLLINVGKLYFFWLIFIYHNFNNYEPQDDSGEENWNNAGLAYFIALCCYKSAEVLGVGFLLYGMWKKRSEIVKMYLLFSVAAWIISIIFIVIMCFFIYIFYRLILIAILLLHGYTLLNIRSVYLQMTGKSKILQSGVIIRPSTVSNVTSHSITSSQDSQSINNTSHCRTCSCVQSSLPMSGVIYQRLHSSASSAVLSSPTSEGRSFTNDSDNLSDGGKVKNFKDAPIIYDENQLTQNYRIAERAQGSGITFQRPFQQTQPNTGIDIDEKDIPVIYDQSQMNVGSSSILEDSNTSRNQYILRERHNSIPSSSSNI